MSHSFYREGIASGKSPGTSAVFNSSLISIFRHNIVHVGSPGRPLIPLPPPVLVLPRRESRLSRHPRPSGQPSSSGSPSPVKHATSGVPCDVIHVSTNQLVVVVVQSHHAEGQRSSLPPLEVHHHHGNHNNEAGDTGDDDTDRRLDTGGTAGRGVVGWGC